MSINCCNEINNFSTLSQSIKYISSLIPDSYDYMGNTHKIKIFSKSLGFSQKYSNSRWICSFLPEEINTVIDGNTEPMTVSVIPASSDIKPVREQILLLEDSDITVTMLDDSPSGTYVSGVHSKVDGSTLRTGYEKA